MGSKAPQPPPYRDDRELPKSPPPPPRHSGNSTSQNVVKALAAIDAPKVNDAGYISLDFKVVPIAMYEAMEREISDLKQQLAGKNFIIRGLLAQLHEAAPSYEKTDDLKDDSAY